MSASIEQSLDRAERALLRIRRSVERASMERPAPPTADSSRDDALRARVVEVVAELDSLIRDAEGVR